MGAPIAVLGSAAGFDAGNGSSLTIDVPSEARSGVHLLGVITATIGSDPVDLVANGWTLHASPSWVDGKLWIISRECTDDEPSSYSFVWGGIPAGGPATMGALLVLANFASAVGDALATQFAAAANPIVAATAAAQANYTDAHITVWAIDNDDGFTAIDGLVIQVAANADFDGSFAIHFGKLEAAGDVGDRSISATTAGADGFYAQVILRGGTPDTAQQLTALDPPGSIGLPWVGA